jgi:hypothetical protein
MVGYNVQVAVDTSHHLIVAHEVTNEGTDHAQLAKMAYFVGILPILECGRGTEDTARIALLSRNGHSSSRPRLRIRLDRKGPKPAVPLG